MNHIIRDIEINKILDIPLTGLSKLVDDFFYDFSNKVVFKVLNCSLYMLIDDEIYMEQEYDNGKPIWCLWCRYQGFWSYIEKNITSNDTEISELIKYKVEEMLRSKVNRPDTCSAFCSSSVKELLRCEVNRPSGNGIINAVNVSIKLKNIISIDWEWILKTYCVVIN